MEDLQGYLNFENTENQIATPHNSHWIIYVDPTRPRGNQNVKIYYPGADDIECSSLFSAGQHFGVIMDRNFGFANTAVGVVQLLKVVAYFARFNLLYKDFSEFVCPVCSYKFQLYFDRGKDNNQYVYRCKRAGSGHRRSKTVLGFTPNWFARTQLELFLFVFFFLGFFNKYPQWIILNEINRPNLKVISKDTVSQHYNHLRNVSMLYVEQNFQKLGGINTNTTV